MAKQRKCLVWMQLKDDDSEIPNPLKTKKVVPQTTLSVRTEDKVEHHRTTGIESS